MSPCEREVLVELIHGRNNEDIADDLGIALLTVELHKANIFEKMGAASAVERAHKLGRLEPIGTAPGA